MTKSRHKAAVMGTGSIGYRHMQVLNSLRIPVTTVSIRQERRFELRAQGWTTAGSLREAREAGATFAVIATDTGRHVADATEALGLGLHVLLEKPMAASAGQARHLPGMAADLGLKLFVGCPLRFDPGLGVIRERLREIGAIHSARIECRSYLPDWRPHRDYHAAYSSKAQEGGVLRDLIHEIDYALWLFGVPREVYGGLRNLGRLEIQGEELAEGFWFCPSGACVSVGLDYLSRQPHRVLSAYGSLGSLEYDFIRRTLCLQKVGCTSEAISFNRSPDDIYIHQMKEFLQALSGGASRRLTTAEEGLNALAVCDVWRRSATSRQAMDAEGITHSINC